MVPTVIDLLSAWEVGAARPDTQRAPSLLASLGLVPARQSVGALTVGQCDARLFALRRELFGDGLELVATCPTCGSDLELTLSVSEVEPTASPDTAAPVRINHDGCTVLARIPVNDDLDAVAAGSGELGIQDLVARCLLEARDRDGRTVPAAELPEATARLVVEAMAEADPGVETTLRLRCPCGEEWVDEIDIRSILWTELSDWVARTLSDVQQLAAAYGWSERESLAIPAWRRRWYLEAAGP